MNLSLNEVEAMAKKAARGTGYPWGLAEEAAKATRWLCEQGIDGCAELARLLTRIDQSDRASAAPRTDSKVWSAAGSTLCPLLTGAAISDRSACLRTQDIHLKSVGEPLLLLPFIAQSASNLETRVNIAWPGVSATSDGLRISLEGKPGVCADKATVKIGGEFGNLNPLASRAEPDRNAYETLNKLAHRTYAPATEESRLLGAGAGLSDND